jgi:hypothetical protein
VAQFCSPAAEFVFLKWPWELYGVFVFVSLWPAYKRCGAISKNYVAYLMHNIIVCVSS